MLGGWNWIMKKARGKYIKFLASDDLLEPTCVQELVDVLESHPRVALATCRRRFSTIDTGHETLVSFANKDVVINGREHAHWILTDLRENKIGEPTAVLFRRRYIKRAGYFDQTFSQFADFEYWIRLLEFGSIAYIHKVLCTFRLHGGSNTSAAIRDGRFITETFALIRKYYDSPRYRRAFRLTDNDRRQVTRQKSLDIAKNIKDLLIAGNTPQALRYTSRLIAR